jgi:hypothetical protein
MGTLKDLELVCTGSCSVLLTCCFCCCWVLQNAGAGGTYTYANPPPKIPCPAGTLTQVMRAGNVRACGEQPFVATTIECVNRQKLVTTAVKGAQRATAKHGILLNSSL